jgi:hypothetical protein
MASSKTQERAHDFLCRRFRDLEPFTKEQFRKAAGWTPKAFPTYWRKQFERLVEPVDQTRFRLRETFRPYLDWERFRRDIVSQVRRVGTDYKLTNYDSVIVYEFYIPLTHEAVLRETLDALFLKDEILPRLRRSNIGDIEKVFERQDGESDVALLERICDFIAGKFGGYSIYHVDGRFRSTGLRIRDEVAEMGKRGERYLVDETTAVTRFIFPCKQGEPEKVRFLFQELFLRTITQRVNEDQIWVVESGMKSSVQIWAAQ